MTTKIQYRIVAVAFDSGALEQDRLTTHEGLATEVNGYLEDGWQPLGGPFLNQDMIYQALVKHPHTEPDPSLANGQQLKTTFAEKKQFSERFSQDDWLTLCRHADFVDALGRSIPDAETVALRLLSRGL